MNFINKLRIAFPYMTRKRMAFIRRKFRAPFINDKIDPYFSFRRKMKKGEINYKWTDKVWIKEQVSEIKGLKVAKVYFKFNKKGEIISGSVPNSGKVVLKHNISAYSDSVVIIDAKDINGKVLRKFFLENFYRDKANISRWNMSGYFPLNSIFFAEEFLPWVPETFDYKIFTFDSGFINALETPNINKENGIIAKAWTEDFKSTLHPSSMIFAKEDISTEMKDNFRKMDCFARKIYEKVGHFARIDFYCHEGMIYLGEVTPNPSVGLIHDKRKFSKARQTCEDMKICERVFDSFDDPLVKKHIMRYINKWNDSFPK